MLSHVRIRCLITSQQKNETFGQHPPFYNFAHLASRSMFWVPVTSLKASLGLKLTKLVYPHLSLSGPSFLVILLEWSSDIKYSTSSLGAWACHQFWSFHDLKILFEFWVSQNSATLLWKWFWRTDLNKGELPLNTYFIKFVII